MTKEEKILIGKAIQKELSKAEKKGYILFFLALKDHAKKVVPYLGIYGSQMTLLFLDTLVEQEPISRAYKEHYEATIQRMLSVNLRIMIRMVEGKYQKDKLTDQINIGFRSEEIIKQTADEANKMGLASNVKNVTDYTRELIRKEIEQGLEKNLTKEQIARNITKVTDGTIAKMRALRISRTETTHANSKSTEILSNAIPFEQVKIWIPRIDGRERPEHGAMLNKKPILKKEPFIVGGERLMYPGDSSLGASASNVVNCYLPNNFIESNITEAQRSFYSGKAFEIITSRGECITVTPNHGILTTNGFTAAKSINVGDNLVCNRFQKNPFVRLVNNYIKKKLFRVDNVFGSLVKLWSLKKTVVTTLDFDKDGHSMYGNIDIVYPKVKLTNSINTKLFKYFNNFKLMPTSFEGGEISRLSTFHFFGSGYKSSSTLLMSLLNLSFPLLFRHISPLNRLTFGLASRLNVVRFKQSSNSRSTDKQFLRELIDTNSANISFDNVVSVREFDFFGHVYDFSSYNGTNIVNNIYTSNCRCSQHYIPIEPDFEEEGQQPLYSSPNVLSYLKNLLKGILNIKW